MRYRVYPLCRQRCSGVLRLGRCGARFEPPRYPPAKFRYGQLLGSCTEGSLTSAIGSVKKSQSTGMKAWHAQVAKIRTKGNEKSMSKVCRQSSIEKVGPCAFYTSSESEESFSRPRTTIVNNSSGAVHISSLYFVSPRS